MPIVDAFAPDPMPQGDPVELKATSRRNHMIGMWAAEKMGLNAGQAESYARAVERAHSDRPSEEDVIRKVLGDLTASNVHVRESEVRTKAAEFLAQAREALKGTS